MENKEKVKALMSDGKKRFISEVSEELDIHPREVRKIFLSLDKDGFWISKNTPGMDIFLEEARKKFCDMDNINNIQEKDGNK